MTRHDNFREPTAYTMAEWPDRAPDRHPDTLVWIERIEAVRRLTPAPTERRCIGPCGRMLPLDDAHFTRNRSQRGGGRHYVCRDCDAARKRRARQQEKVRAFRAALGAAS